MCAGQKRAVRSEEESGEGKKRREEQRREIIEDSPTNVRRSVTRYPRRSAYSSSGSIRKAPTVRDGL